MEHQRQAAPGQGLSLQDRNPERIRALMPIWQWLYDHYFRVQTSGWENIPAAGQFLFVGSHNGGLAAPDLPMFMVDWFQRFGYDRKIYGLTHPKVWKVYPPLAHLAAQMGAIQAKPQMAIAALRQGASVLVYPGGAQDVFRPYSQRHKIHFAGRLGFIKLALREGIPIIPIVSWGAHETLFVLADCYAQAKWLHARGMPWLLDMDPEVFPIYLGLPWGIALGPLPNLPLPAQIHTRVGQPIHFERSGRETLRDLPYLQSCYDKVLHSAQKELSHLIEAKGSHP